MNTIPILMNGEWTLNLLPHRAGQWANMWEAERLKSIHQHVKQGDCVFDIGAEEGDMTALYASWGADVVIVEASERYWPNIKATFEANGLTDKIVGAYNGFAGPKTLLESFTDIPSKELPECSANPISTVGGFCNLWERPDIGKISIDALASFIDRDPDIITIDVEGSELEVLTGASETIATCKPLLYVSIHDQFMKDMYGQCAKDVYDFLEGLGYTWEVLADEHETHVLFYQTK